VSLVVIIISNAHSMAFKTKGNNKDNRFKNLTKTIAFIKYKSEIQLEMLKDTIAGIPFNLLSDRGNA